MIKYWEKDSKYPGTPKTELYNIAEDPFEKNDLFKSERVIADKLLSELLTTIEEYGGITEKTSIESGIYRSWRALQEQ